MSTNEHTAAQPATTETKEAGLELDSLMAGRIMEWRHVRNDDARTDDLTTYMIRNGKVLRGNAYKTKYSESYFHQFEPWSPSTNIAQAFEVVEKLRERWRTGDTEEEYWQFVDCQEVGWRVDVMWSHHDGDVCTTFASANTLPLAICRAAALYALALEEAK